VPSADQRAAAASCAPGGCWWVVALPVVGVVVVCCMVYILHTAYCVLRVLCVMCCVLAAYGGPHGPAVGSWELAAAGACWSRAAASRRGRGLAAALPLLAAAAAAAATATAADRGRCRCYLPPLPPRPVWRVTPLREARAREPLLQAVGCRPWHRDTPSPSSCSWPGGLLAARVKVLGGHLHPASHPITAIARNSTQMPPLQTRNS
jgi:hypothetical protein